MKIIVNDFEFKIKGVKYPNFKLIYNSNNYLYDYKTLDLPSINISDTIIIIKNETLLKYFMKNFNKEVNFIIINEDFKVNFTGFLKEILQSRNKNQELTFKTIKATYE